MIAKVQKKRSSFLLAVLAVLVIFSGCGESENSSDILESSASIESYFIEVKTNGGMSLSNVGVYVYTDTTCDDLVWAGTTDEKGSVAFTAEASDKYAVELRNAPTDFLLENSYLLNKTEIEIRLEPNIVDQTDFNHSYKLGDVIKNFKVSSFDGNEYEISELLETKKAVVLNFWFLGCTPCKMEFPFMQEAYEDFKNDIEIIALNPLDGTDKKIGDYASSLGLSFPMAVCDFGWEKSMNLTAYPTTVVIDRYGMITMIHKGSITDKETFVKIFSYFTADDYQQKLVKTISDIN